MRQPKEVIQAELLSKIRSPLSSASAPHAASFVPLRLNQATPRADMVPRVHDQPVTASNQCGLFGRS